MNKHTSDAASKQILIVEDEAEIAYFVQRLLEREGFSCHHCNEGARAMADFERHQPDLVILDWMLPGGLDGLEICTRIRQHPTNPNAYILMLTAKAEELDQVIGLSTGADDYLVKPFSPMQLVARVRALLRRRLRETEKEQIYRTPHFTLNVEQHTATRQLDNQPPEELALAALDFKLLAAFMSHPGKAWTRNQLIENLWGDDFLGDDRVVDTQIARLRKKIEPNSSQPMFIKTVIGVGYKFEDNRE